ncbi:MAG: hypothetical protein LN568_05725 [Rickettsia endosymbiont of Pseudomimeciton antennatum]|nr:hypothetical protein [Rickettsia endosymbiont of Pseudomimeciton antennatum]
MKFKYFITKGLKFTAWGSVAYLGASKFFPFDAVLADSNKHDSSKKFID